MLDRILTIDFCELVRILLIILPTDMRPTPLSNQIDFFLGHPVHYYLYNSMLE